MSVGNGLLDWSQEEQPLVRQMMEQLPDVAYVSSLDTGELIYLNGAVAAVTGFTPEELRAMRVEGARARIHPDDRDRYVAAIRELLERGGSQTLEYRWLHKDGRYRWLSNSRTVRLAEDGHTKLLMGTLRDVTDQKETEAALRESEERFRAIHEASPDGLMILNAVRDERGQIVDLTWEYLNPVAERLNRTTTAERRGQRMLQLYNSPADREFFQRYVQVIETGQPQETEVHYQSADIDAWFRNVAVKVGDGVAITFTDITERKRAEQEYERNLDRLDTLLRVSTTVLKETTLEGLLQAVADAARELTGARVVSSGHGYVGGTFRVGAASHAPDAYACPPGQEFKVERGGVYLDLIYERDSIRLSNEELRHHPHWWGLPPDHGPLQGRTGKGTLTSDFLIGRGKRSLA